MRAIVRRGVLCVGAALAAACGGDGPSAPSGPPQITGSYTLNQSNLNGTINGVAMSCSVTGTTMTITQTTTTFTGTYNGGTITCSANGQSASEGIGSGTVVNGTIDAAGNVQFDLDTQDYRLVGKVSGNSMSGSATARLTIDGTTSTMTGNWSASRTTSAANASTFSIGRQGGTLTATLAGIAR
ncbi:MAG TPA: hypothetical protein VFS33_11550 [Gemmatimonadales bacterium]|nr:hypothetical protein [Gemmatimonadales bacterium]